jgi:hypothetical protein
MAKELVDAMVKPGFPTFTPIGHDREAPGILEEYISTYRGPARTH